MSDIYYTPEEFGLTPIGQVDFSTGCCEFDYCAVWLHEETGQLYYADDSGCSCPIPFDGHHPGEGGKMTKFSHPAELAAHLLERQRASDHNPACDIVELLSKVMEVNRKK